MLLLDEAGRVTRVVEAVVLVEHEADPSRIVPVRPLQGSGRVQLLQRALEQHGPVGQGDGKTADVAVEEALPAVRLDGRNADLLVVLDQNVLLPRVAVREVEGPGRVGWGRRFVLHQSLNLWISGRKLRILSGVVVGHVMNPGRSGWQCL